MPKKSVNKRIERIELVCMGAGLLLKKLRYSYGSDFGELVIDVMARREIEQ